MDKGAEGADESEPGGRRVEEKERDGGEDLRSDSFGAAVATDSVTVVVTVVVSSTTVVSIPVAVSPVCVNQE